MGKNNNKHDRPECKGNWRFALEIFVGLISPFLPDIFDFLMKLLHLWK